MGGQVSNSHVWTNEYVCALSNIISSKNCTVGTVSINIIICTYNITTEQCANSNSTSVSRCFTRARKV